MILLLIEERRNGIRPQPAVRGQDCETLGQIVFDETTMRNPAL